MDGSSDPIVAHSEAAIAKGSSSFQAAARLFGRSLREDVWQLYAWCRHCDDEIDGQDHGGGNGEPAPLDAQERALRLERLRKLTRHALAGVTVTDPAFKAFQRVALRHALPERWPLELLDGFALDVEARPSADLGELLRYGWGVAGVVGVMMATIMGVKDTVVLRRAQDLGLAFQLTNICRDVREDARNGRLYLPMDALTAAGAPPTVEGMLDEAHAAAVFSVVAQHLEIAERYYASARVGLRDLPFRGALAVAAARGIYREIGRRIVRTGPTALGTRMSVPKPRMVLFLLQGGVLAIWSRVERLLPRPERPDLWTHI